MRLVRLYFYKRKIVIYHATPADIMHAVRCILQRHEYVTVMEYPSVGAKEERCIHCTKPRYRIDHRVVSARRVIS